VPFFLDEGRASLVVSNTILFSHVSKIYGLYIYSTLNERRRVRSLFLSFFAELGTRWCYQFYNSRRCGFHRRPRREDVPLRA